MAKPNPRKGLPCSKCQQPLDGAHKYWCKACMAAYAREHNPWDEQRKEYQRQRYRADPQRFLEERTAARYGITVQELRKLRHKKKCQICGGPGTYIDHTGPLGKGCKVRGVLCSKCNLDLGHFNDDPALLAKAQQYLVLTAL